MRRSAAINQNGKNLKQYLLGQLGEKDEEQVEIRLLTDAVFGEELEIVADELIDRYVEGKIPESDLPQFENHFLASPARQDALAFAFALKKKKAQLRRAKLYKTYLPAIAAAVVVGFTLFVWRAVKEASDVDRGLMALRSAYQNQRPLEARITDFNYAPQQRGKEENVNYVQRDLAARLLLGEVAENSSSADAHRALGQYYLASREPDKAADQLKEAVKLNPKDAKAHADLGAALLEIGKVDLEAGRADAVQRFAESLQHLNTALELNDSLNEAVFNRALLYGYMKLPSQADAEWQSYLAKDPNSPWAVEARRSREALEQQHKSTSQTSEEFLQAFRNAFDARDHVTAWQLVSNNHHRTGNTVFEQALDAYVDSVVAGRNDQAQATLRLLFYVGDLERRQAGDNFFTELTGFYAAASKERLVSLAKARSQLKTAHEGWGRSPVAESLTQFSAAKELFEHVADDWEALFAGYWISFCLYQQHQTKEGWARLQPLIATARARGYHWLTARMLYLSSILQYDLTNYSHAVELAKSSLSLAEDTHDLVAQLNGLSSLIEYYRYLSHFDESLSYVQRSLSLLGRSALDPIQGCRHYGFVARSFAAGGWYEAAAAYQQEALQYAFQSGRPATISTNLAFLSEIQTKLNRFDEALRAADGAFQVAQAGDAGDAASKDRMAYAALQIAHVYRRTGSCDKAIESYDRAIKLYTDINYFTQIYHGHKGRLFCYLARGEDSLAEQEITTALGLVESYRNNIFEAANRETFFDAEQSVYDVAIGFQYSKLNSPQKAFDYSESSRGRSLLDLLNSDARVRVKNPLSELVIRYATNPLTLEQIQQRLPAKVQVLQFAVLDDQLLIWVIAEKKLVHTAVPITREQLQEKISRYLRLLSSVSDDSAETSNHARELYNLLIEPIASVLDGDKQLCVIPDKILNFLPFSTLISPTSGDYLLEDFVLTTSPSATMLVLLSESAEHREVIKDDLILSVGDPNFVRTAYPALTDLPSAEWEATTVARLYQAQRLLVKDRATTHAVVTEMPNANTIHFALHAVLDTRFPTRSRFLMAPPATGKADVETNDSALFAYDIYGLSLTRTKLAVLSACETGTGRYFGGEGVINMARPFLASGVPLVVASLWRVESNSTAELMVNFHRMRLKPGVTTAQALQRAQLATLQDSDQRLHHPYYWAPFVVIGGYAEF